MSRSEGLCAGRGRRGKLSSALTAVVDAVRTDPETAPSEASPEAADVGLEGDSSAETSGSTAAGEETSDRAFGRSEMPEETLFRLLTDNGGRIKQSTLVEETSWSAARVSRRLKNLETAGWVCRVRQGRENVVFVPRAE